MSKRLTKSRDNRMVSGVLGGISEYLNVDPSLVRIIFVVLSIFSSGFTIILYIALAIILPEPDKASRRDVTRKRERKTTQESDRKTSKDGEDDWSDF